MGRFAVLVLSVLATTALAPSEIEAGEMIQSHEHVAEQNGVRLRIWEKVAGDANHRPVVVLAHGSATAGEESFDLQVTGKTDTSLMDVLAHEGFDVFAPDVRGFGRSTHPETGVTTDEAQLDLDAVIDHVRTIRGEDKVHLVAWSWGTQYAGLEVIAHPEKIARYVSFAQMHAASPDIQKRRERLEDFKKGPYFEVPEAAWSKRFTSMTPADVNDPEIVAAYVRAAFAIEKRTPTGPQIDMTTRLPMVDAAKITVPTMIVHGEYDDVADTAGLLPFFARLATTEKRYVIVPKAGHMAQFQAGRGTLFRAISDFLKR